MLVKFLLPLLAFFKPHRSHDVPVGPISDSDILEARTALHGEHYGGDILFDEDVSDGGVKDTRYRWPGYPGKGIIPYVIHSSMTQHKDLILKAMDQYNKLTCIKFVPRENERDYVYVYSGNGCYSYLGKMRRGGGQPVSLGQGCLYHGTILHELGHTIGLNHEHQRSDRDEYVTIYKGNVTNDHIQYFAKVDKRKELLYTPYDYRSIMHYGNYAFSRDPHRQPTMEAKNGQRLLEPYEKPGLTNSDVQTINQLYQCR